jgi:crossover junction endodeoxyribonuclease RusA
MNMPLSVRHFRVFVPGHAAPQGSKRHVGHGVIVESSTRLKPWRSDVQSRLMDADGQPLVKFDSSPVKLSLEFVLKRPVSTPKRATPQAAKKPDLDKLIRAVADAITDAGIWRDDSQIVMLQANKRLAELAETPGCWIHILGISE